MAQTTIVELASGTETTTEDMTINSHSPSGGKRAILFLVAAVNSSGSVNFSVSGGGTTWQREGAINTETDYGGRRSMAIFETVGNLTSADIDLTLTPTGTWQETMWLLVEVSNHATDMIAFSSTRGGISSSGSPATTGTTLTVGTDDLAVGFFGLEQTSITGFSFASGMTSFKEITGGANVRRLAVGTRLTTGDITASWTGASLWGGMAFVISNGSESSGGGGSIIPQAFHHYRNNSGSGL